MASRRFTVMRAAFLVVALGLLAVPVPALAATASLGVPHDTVRKGTVMKSSSAARLTFRLGAGWKLVHGAMAGTPAIGSYSRTVGLSDGQRCALSFFAYGVTLLAHPRPVLDRGRLHVSAPKSWEMDDRAVAARGENGRRQWFTLRARPVLRRYFGGFERRSFSFDGVGVLRTPAWLLPKSRAVTEVGVWVEALPATPGIGTASQTQACSTYMRSHAPHLLDQVLRTLRVERLP